MSKIIISILVCFAINTCFADGKFMLKNKARRYCRNNPEKCEPSYLMEKFEGLSVTKTAGENGCSNINIQNTSINTDKEIGEIDVDNELIMGDLIVICD